MQISHKYRFPKLDAVDSALLYRRAQALLRLVESGSFFCFYVLE